MVAIAASAAALVSLLIGASHHVGDVVVISAALIVGDVVDLRPAGRAAMPVAFAIVLVLLRAATPNEFVIIVAVAAVIATVIRRQPESFGHRPLFRQNFLLLLTALVRSAA